MSSLRDSPVRLAVAALALLVAVPVVLVTLATPVALLWFRLRPGADPATLPAVGGLLAGGDVAPLALLALLAGVGLVLAGRRIGGPSGDLALARLWLAHARGNVSEPEYERRRERIRGDGPADEERLQDDGGAADEG